jgi:hypothetical protein
LRTSAICGGDARGPDCFFSFCFGLFFVNVHVLSSNTRFFRTSVARDLLANCTCHVLME